MLYSLAQKRMMAYMARKDEVVLTMEEADAVLEHISDLSATLAKYSEYLPEDVIHEECEEMFGPRPNDSLRRCIHCNQFPDGPVACCDKFDGSFYWEDVFEEDE